MYTFSAHNNAIFSSLSDHYLECFMFVIYVGCASVIPYFYNAILPSFCQNTCKKYFTSKLSAKS